MLLARLLQRGDEVELTEGRLVITPISGRPVCPLWLKQHRDNLIAQILRVSGCSGFQYLSYSTGNYVKAKGAGITLQFTNIVSGEGAYSIFNADLTRTRKSKHGDVGSALPKGQFRPRKGSDFISFWKQSGLTLPARMGSFHDYMGNLKPIVFTGQFSKGERLQSKSISPLSLSSARLKTCLKPDINHTAAEQYPDKAHTTQPYSELPQSQIPRGQGANKATGINHYGKRSLGSEITRAAIYPTTSLEKQSQEQWLEDYGLDD